MVQKYTFMISKILYTIHLKTNCAVSEDVVRVASNNTMSNSALPVGGGGTPLPYTGQSYRSVIFELANYRPFHFAALVNGQGEYERYAVAEKVSNLEWSYVPNQDVDISFEITSFKGSDNKSVDPFGEEFEVIIDAPMLDLDLTRLTAYNLNDTKITRRADGKFVYTVAADRGAERAFGYGTVLNADEMGVDQTGERKTIPFKTNTITSAGTITISSNKEQVVFYDKQFKVTNSQISGTIQYTDDGVTMIDVPQYDFVAFARTSDGTRIGSVNVGANGAYSLNLRKEYSFNWYTDAIEFDYIHPVTKKVYEAKVTSLNSLFTSPNVVLAQP